MTTQNDKHVEVRFTGHPHRITGMIPVGAAVRYFINGFLSAILLSCILGIVLAIAMSSASNDEVIRTPVPSNTSGLPSGSYSTPQ